MEHVGAVPAAIVMRCAPNAQRCFDAIMSLVRTQRRLAHQYRHWAAADEAAGNQERYRRYRNESARLWKSAFWHLNQARMWKEKHSC